MKPPFNFIYFISLIYLYIFYIKRAQDFVDIDNYTVHLLSMHMKTPYQKTDIYAGKWENGKAYVFQYMSRISVAMLYGDYSDEFDLYHHSDKNLLKFRNWVLENETAFDARVEFEDG